VTRTRPARASIPIAAAAVDGARCGQEPSDLLLERATCRALQRMGGSPDWRPLSRSNTRPSMYPDATGRPTEQSASGR
jgi:hypothetical protein